MRSFEIKSLAILASSLLVKETFAAPIYETEIHVVTEEVTVTRQLDGSYATGFAHAVGTYTQHHSAAASSVVIVASTPAPAAVTSAVVVPTSSTTSQVVVESSSAKPSSSSSSVAVVKASTEAAAAAVFVQTSAKAAATTLATSAKASSAAAAVISSSSSSSSSGGKRGVAYNTADYVKQFTGSSKVAWAYNWGSSSDGLSASGIEFVPLLWGLKSTFTGAWSAAASSAIASGSTHLMSFNEPDLSTQANIGASDAAAGYKTYMQPFAGKAKLGAPAVTNGASPMGLTWLKSFLSSCSDCTIDFVCIHWYDSASNAAYFKQYVQDAYTAGGNRPLWITEFQASGSTDEQNAFMKEVLPWLDASTMVDRYAWFMADTAAGGLMSSTSALSTLGNTFKTA
ncbi:uncharacterized protein EAF01_008271 [Botrytis porri]|uniref:Asl1-like glycosyl hydrolase catalytic domain-containing protein n=1 Tax=Botrytis porri TaxID=87229 RepID=A0A4Z1L747_9HELO|nr:uncharacterized protein EAF01_008271 [Botrytis porri]KAF7899058.1 hypothetical protein EAF01_008271 [Botrytis porri]TGO92577.1 hypothetical protein BPOR_0001g00620 [Botrytis porri]